MAGGLPRSLNLHTACQVVAWPNDIDSYVWKNDLGVGDWYLQEKECRIRVIPENTSYIFSIQIKGVPKDCVCQCQKN